MPSKYFLEDCDLHPPCMVYQKSLEFIWIHHWYLVHFDTCACFPPFCTYVVCTHKVWMYFNLDLTKAYAFMSCQNRLVVQCVGLLNGTWSSHCFSISAVVKTHMLHVDKYTFSCNINFLLLNTIQEFKSQNT